ncbi:MAG: hypothetical protein MI810_17425 [Flavobacteriales bacterium]|nr:hypothetical protein [Flavobacteriales bacterium]
MPVVAAHLMRRGGFSLSLVRSRDLSPAERALPDHRQRVGLHIRNCRLDQHDRQTLIDQACAPADRRLVIAHLGRLAKLIRATREDAADWEGLIRVFTDKIAGHYPAAAVTAVLEDWPDHNRFWPAWCDLKSRLDRESRVLNSLCRQLGEG